MVDSSHKRERTEHHLLPFSLMLSGFVHVQQVPHLIPVVDGQCPVFCLSIHQLMDIWVSTYCLL